MEWKALLASLLVSGKELPPKVYTEDVCQIVEVHPGWSESLKETSRERDIPPGLILSVMYHESTFRAEARPPRKKLLGVIPWQRSSSYGYAQVKDETWRWYKSHNPGWFQSRNQFKDAADFIGWYYQIFRKKNPNIENVYADFYLSYHEGLGGYKRKTYKNNTWLINKSQSVSNMAEAYEIQLKSCL